MKKTKEGRKERSRKKKKEGRKESRKKKKEVGRKRKKEEERKKKEKPASVWRVWLTAVSNFTEFKGDSIRFRGKKGCLFHWLFEFFFFQIGIKTTA